jgi:hypothetical protein
MFASFSARCAPPAPSLPLQLFGFTLAECSILLLPLDVVRGFCLEALDARMIGGTPPPRPSLAPLALWSARTMGCCVASETHTLPRGRGLVSLPGCFCRLTCTFSPTPPVQGNRAGVVGCGFYNNNCGGLDLRIVWKIVYGCIAGMVSWLAGFGRVEPVWGALFPVFPSSTCRCCFCCVAGGRHPSLRHLLLRSG